MVGACAERLVVVAAPADSVPHPSYNQQYETDDEKDDADDQDDMSEGEGRDEGRQDESQDDEDDSKNDHGAQQLSGLFGAMVDVCDAARSRWEPRYALTT